ncbi:NUDIX hydrolase [Kribbella sp. NPDC000426]|uniref:NUDIX hydrolase n=1 Tax=Kribbella sp. NPDC000426 TaxID=3154255 RepID=UPI003325CB21
MIRLTAESATLTEAQALKVQHHLLEFIPTTHCTIYRGPGVVIEVPDHDPDELAPGILHRIEELAACTFRVEPAPDATSPAAMEYSAAMYELPVENTDGSVLLSFDRLVEEQLGGLDPSVPLTASLVVLWCGHECLMVFNRYRQAWELPGGMLDPGESPRDAAVRELEEESGQRADELELVGVAKIRVAPDDRLEYLAIYRGRIDSPQPFTANDEMSDAVWWSPSEPLTDLFPIDAALAILCP